MQIPQAILVSATLAATVSISVIFISKWVERRARRDNILAGLLLEIRGILELTKDGPFKHRFARIRACLENGEPVTVVPFVDRALPLDPFFASAVGELGLLPPVKTASILNFYRNLKLLRMELRSVEELHTQLPKSGLNIFVRRH